MHRLLVVLFLFALPAYGSGFLSRCLTFLRNESGSVAPWGMGDDQIDAEKLAGFAQARPWPGTFVESVWGHRAVEVQRAFLDRIGHYTFAHLFGFDVRFRYSGLVFRDGDVDTAVVEVSDRPQRVLRRNDLPGAERSALNKLLRRPESQLPMHRGFRESLAVVGYLRGGGAVVTEPVLGDENAVSIAAVQTALDEAEAMANDHDRSLFAATLVHVHPEANVPLTKSDVALADHTARAMRSKIRQDGFVAIVVGGAHSPDQAVFRYAAFPRSR